MNNSLKSKALAMREYNNIIKQLESEGKRIKFKANDTTIFNDDSGVVVEEFSESLKLKKVTHLIVDKELISIGGENMATTLLDLLIPTNMNSEYDISENLLNRFMIFDKDGVKKHFKE